ncbi:MAG TPA: ABC-type transport auxiliary lipoprotein family protein [Alphaproteobacteria bacterium]|nr:ABC-type transport auxiliary lipoprotein family protein [Alphaproteobacteria bacterium]
MSPRPSQRRRAARIAAAGLVLLVAACGVKLPGEGPPPRLFALTPKTTFDPNLPKVDWQLIVAGPQAPASLNTVRIALSKTPIEVQYYANAAWVDRVPSMIQTLLIESFENSGKIIAVGRESIDVRADYMLRTEIRHFEVEYKNGTPSPRVRIVAKLIKMPERQIIGDTACDYQTPAAKDTLDSIVESYDEVLGRCMRRIVEWTLRTGTRHRSAGAASHAGG